MPRGKLPRGIPVNDRSGRRHEVPADVLFSFLGSKGFSREEGRSRREVVYGRRHHRDDRYRVLVYTSIAAGAVQSKGIEFDLSGEIAAGLRLTAAYAFTDAKVTQDNAAATGGRAGATIAEEPDIGAYGVSCVGPSAGRCRPVGGSGGG